MRPVIVGLTGAEAITARAQIDAQIDYDEALLARSTEETLRTLLRSQLDLLYGLRAKFDKAMAFREQPPIPAPF